MAVGPSDEKDRSAHSLLSTKVLFLALFLFPRSAGFQVEPYEFSDFIFQSLRVDPFFMSGDNIP